MDSDIVIEVRGGCLVGVYSDNREQRFVLLDWDELNGLPDAERIGGIFPGNPFSEMEQDTLFVYDRTVSDHREYGSKDNI